MKKSLILLAILFLGILSVQAQSDYKASVGGRVGVVPLISISGSLKYFITKPGAIEAYAGFGHTGVWYGFNYFRLGGMYQHHFPIPNVQGLKWYVGGGVLVQFNSYGDSDDFAKTTPGINAVGGVDYKFNNLPLNVSVDFVPIIFLKDTHYSALGGTYGGIAVRYVLK